ncbi:oxygenase MpaB family protein [Nocardia sp. CA2R105]|uniref:oxygenase MpaB family protein n=1 Tax=Nocardia coffeae TaxID=2873381 RepID=UPI001CA698B9|nr:oxygenase MpaB family protein [Nocardia coffeae]MBY8862813.1 oxygenase MpaB family protein [Nocardia coffeae]
MTTHYPDLAQRVRSQPELQPELYGGIDFDTPPYRLATDPEDASALPKWVAQRAPILTDERVVELISTATMLGDTVADPFAALMARHSVTGLVGMVRQACREGVEAVPDAPPELVAFIAAMEAAPQWLDMELVHKGARQARVDAALLSPFITRGAFIATFTNTYAALPMALTGALSGRRAARRVNETANFFAVTTLPGALDRYGPGFEAAAMVRLMHSMVRYNALERSDRWDPEIYGVPVPQVDQMPAGMIGLYLLAIRIRRAGRTEFTRGERALVEFARYRCFLLGLPEELLPTTAEGIIEVFHARAALLRDGFDDATCGGLIRSTMAAYLRAGGTRFDRIADSVEKSYSTAGFVLAFCHGNRHVARRMGVSIGVLDLVRIALTAPFIIGRVLAVTGANRIPMLRPAVDRYLTRLVKRRLAAYGNPEFVSDSKTYTPIAH